MNRRCAVTVKLILLSAAVMLFSRAGVQAQSSLFSELAAGDENVRTFYFYPSTIRVIAKIAFGEEASKTTFRSLSRARLVYASGSYTTFRTKMENLTANKAREGFETLMELNHAGTSVTMMKVGGKQPLSVILISGPDAHYAVEIEGEITPEMMVAMMNGDMGMLKGQFNFGTGKGPEMKMPNQPTDPELDE